jgi:fused signal recognition particle receptor
MVLGRLKTKTGTEDSSFWGRLQAGLSKTRSVLLTDMRDLFNNAAGTENGLLDELESRLIMADVGVESTLTIIGALKQAIKSHEINSAEDVLRLLYEQMVYILKPIECPLVFPADRPGPFTLLVIGVNGTGKTTTIGKLANLYKDDYRVLLVAGDTFRAAAVEQLTAWGEKNNVPVICTKQGADSSAVVYDGLAEAKKIGAEIVIADTAGRLQNKSNLIDELKKIRRTMSKFDADMQVETLLVLDASNGQNALVQAQQFHTEIGVSGIVMTKLDGTAKGGIVFALASKLAIPLRYICSGETITDISQFKAEAFVSALLNLK